MGAEAVGGVEVGGVGQEVVGAEGVRVEGEVIHSGRCLRFWHWLALRT